MKRVIVSSFGLNDNDWIDPPEDYWEGEEGRLWVDIPPTDLIVDDESFASDEDMEKLLDASVTPDSVKDEKYGFDVVDIEDLKDNLAAAIDAAVAEKGIRSSAVRVSGTYYVYYGFLVFNPPVHLYRYEDDYREARKTVDFDSVVVSQVEPKIKVERL